MDQFGSNLFGISLEDLTRDCVEFDEKCNFSHLHEPQMSNVAFFTLALAGETGELVNVVKKIWRDGESPELWQKFDEEVVDILIYLIELLSVTRSPLAKAWAKKQKVLNKRWEKRSGYNLEDRQLNLER